VKKIILFAFWFWTFSVTIAQGTFVKTYDFGTVENSYQIRCYNNRIFVNTATYCGVECSYLSEIDTLGNILWRTEVPDIDIGFGTMVIANDIITITGNDDPLNTAFLMAHFTLDGEKICETIEIEHFTEKFSRMFQLTTQYFNGMYAVCGRGIQSDTMRGLIYLVSKSGIIDTLIQVERADDSRLWDSYIDAEGRLTTYHWVEQHNSIINYRKIFKFDENYDTVWTYRSEDINYNMIVPRGCELQDGRTILAYSRPGGDDLIHSVRAINTDGSVDWQYDYTRSGSRTRQIYRLKTLKNGDIMGSGQYSELTQTPRINESPWLFRMSPDGELLWERTYFDIDTNDNESRRGVIFDFIELDGGDIMAVGNFRYEDNDMLILRVDSNGCLDPYDCKVENIITSNDVISPQINELVIYPNPVRNVLNFQYTLSPSQLKYDIMDITGSINKNGFVADGYGQINVEGLVPGLYFLNLYRDGRRVATGRFVKEG
jgi:type IX secretion system substrate protein